MTHIASSETVTTQPISREGQFVLLVNKVWLKM